MHNLLILPTIHKVLHGSPRALECSALTHQHAVEQSISHRGISRKRKTTRRLAIEDQRHNRLHIHLALVVDNMQWDIFAIMELL